MAPIGAACVEFGSAWGPRNCRREYSKETCLVAPWKLVEYCG